MVEKKITMECDSHYVSSCNLLQNLKTEQEVKGLLRALTSANCGLKNENHL